MTVHFRPEEMPAKAKIKAPDPDLVEVLEFVIDEDEESHGIVEGRAILWDRATVVIFKTNDGLYGFGHSAPRPGYPFDRALGKARARANALKSLLALREKFNMPADESHL